MTIRVVARIDDAIMAANVGGSVLVTYRTFEVEMPVVEAFLRAEPESKYEHRQVVGIELVSKDPSK